MAACGHGKNGALAVLQRGIQPELVTEVEAGILPGLRGTWTVYRARLDVENSLGSANGSSSSGTPPFHSYLVIALAASTMVLETGEELKEVSEQVELVTDASTVCCGNVFLRGEGGRNARIVQVRAKGVRVAAGPKMTQDFSTNDLGASEDGLEIVTASVCDPYVACRFTDGSLAILDGRVHRDPGPAPERRAREQLPKGADVTAACLVDDGVPAATHPGLDARAPGFLRRGCAVGLETDHVSHSMLALARVGGLRELDDVLPSCARLWCSDGLSEGIALLGASS